MDRTSDILSTTVEHLIAAIEAGASDLAMPWTRLGGDILSPTNAATGDQYRGGNRWVLALNAMLDGLDGGTWATYRQWQGLDAQVRKGEHAIAAVLRPIERNRTETDTDTGEETTYTWTTFRPIAVFHSSQVDGWQPDPSQLVDHEPIAEADALVTAWRAAGMEVMEGGDIACYEPTTDRIRVPLRGQFPVTEHWYSVQFHEAGHWTARRVGRDMADRFPDSRRDAYAAEELVAELTAAVLGTSVGIEQATREDHAAYLAHWVGILRQDPRHLWTVAGQAERAADYLLDLAGADR